MPTQSSSCRSHDAASMLGLRWLLLMLITLPLVGCRGCTLVSSSKANKQDGEKDKQRLSVSNLKMLPATPDSAMSFLKPGHWAQARQDAKANQADEALTVNLQVMNPDQRPVPIAGAELRFTRDVSLPKGQQKSSEFLAYVPEIQPAFDDQLGTKMTRATLQVQFAQRGLGSPIDEQSFPTSMLPPIQFMLPILSKEPTRYTYWNGLSCIVWPSDSLLELDKISPSRVVELKEDQIRLWLPDQLHAWTSISHLVWTDIDAGSLSELQQTALLDWLHFGGQIIVSGPDCLAGLSNSFLAPYLPISSLKSEDFTDDDVKRLNDGWLIRASDGLEVPLILPTSRAVPKIGGTLIGRSNWVDRAESLIAERQIGQGRVVMTMFPLGEDLFIRWPSYGSLVNGALLRKPAREWRTNAEGGSLVWAGMSPGLEVDPRFSTMCRFISRDLGLDLGLDGYAKSKVDLQTIRSNARTSRPDSNASEFDNPSQKQARTTNVASWNDQSRISRAAEVSLRAASGISVPRIGTIIKLLAGYLLVLVPLNWILFRIIGRVELAWLAAPVIAVIGAFVVARSVQLDIGFSRSENRIGCLELQAGYARGHLTTYASLYSSLSTDYRALFPEANGVVLPFSSSSSNTASGSRSRRSGDRRTMDYRYASSDGNGLVGLTILSNTMEMIHAEETVALGGVIRGSFADDSQASMKIANQSPVRIRDAAIVGSYANGERFVGWVGDMESNRDISVELQKSVIPRKDLWFDHWELNPATKMQDVTMLTNGRARLDAETESGLSIGVLLERILKDYSLSPGESLLIAWTDQSLSSLQVYPKATQRNASTMLVVHLTPPILPAALADRSMPGIKKLEEDEEL